MHVPARVAAPQLAQVLGRLRVATLREAQHPAPVEHRVEEHGFRNPPAEPVGLLDLLRGGEVPPLGEDLQEVARGGRDRREPDPLHRGECGPRALLGRGEAPEVEVDRDPRGERERVADRRAGLERQRLQPPGERLGALRVAGVQVHRDGPDALRRAGHEAVPDQLLAGERRPLETLGLLPRLLLGEDGEDVALGGRRPREPLGGGLEAAASRGAVSSP